MKNLVMGGVGLTLLTADDALQTEQAGKVAIWPQETFPIDLSFVYLPEREQSPILQAVKRSIEFIWNVSALKYP